MRKLLSVSVAAYNVEKYIVECLESFVMPELQERVEVLIVNDGSTDGTEYIINDYEKKYPGVFRVINKVNGGWGSTLNVAIAQATGKYFKQLDGDDLFENGNLKLFIDRLDECDSDVIVTPYIIFEDDTYNVQKIVDEVLDLSYAREYKISQISNPMKLAMHACTFKLKLLQENGIRITENCFYTDAEYTLKSLNVSNTVTYFEMPIYKYRVGRLGQSVSNEGLKKHYAEHLKVLYTLLEYEKKYVRKEYLDAYRERMKDLVQVQYNIFWLLSNTESHRQELKEFDSFLYSEFPQYLLQSKKMNLLRRAKYTGLALLWPRMGK